jgi:hypothetical protein
MPLPFRKVVAKMTRMPAHVHALRLEASPLYLRREREAANTRELAKMRAHHYTSAQFRPRWEDAK